MSNWDNYLAILTHGLQKRKKANTTSGGAFFAAIYSISATQLRRFCGTDNFKIEPDEEDGLRKVVDALKANTEKHLYEFSHLTLSGMQFQLCEHDRDGNDNPEIRLRRRGGACRQQQQQQQLFMYVHVEERSSVTMNGNPLLFLGAEDPEARNKVRENLMHTGQALFVDLQ